MMKFFLKRCHENIVLPVAARLQEDFGELSSAHGGRNVECRITILWRKKENIILLFGMDSIM
jgi:hypothetical protein